MPLSPTPEPRWRLYLNQLIEILDIPDFDERAFVANNMRYMLLIAFFAALYIANARHAERQMRQINALQEDLKQARWEYMSTMSKLMYNSKQTEVAKRVEHIGLQELTQPPRKIEIE